MLGIRTTTTIAEEDDLVAGAQRVLGRAAQRGKGYTDRIAGRPDNGFVLIELMIVKRCQIHALSSGPSVIGSVNHNRRSGQSRKCLLNASPWRW